MWWGGGWVSAISAWMFVQLIGGAAEHLYRVPEERSKTLSGKKTAEVHVTGWRGSGCG